MKKLGKFSAWLDKQISQLTPYIETSVDHEIGSDHVCMLMMASYGPCSIGIGAQEDGCGDEALSCYQRRKGV